MIQIPNQLNKFRFIKTFRKNALEKAWPIDPVRFKRNSDNSWTDNIKSIIYKSKGQVYKEEIHSYSYQEMQYHLDLSKDAQNNTYGVLCGFNGLVVVDLDDKKIAKKLSTIWPFSDTFAITSAGKELPHFYFKCEDYSKVIRYDGSNNKRMLDVQGTSSYVIGPNSIIRSNNQTKIYEIHQDNPIIEISHKELIKLIEENIGESHKIQKKEKHIYTDTYFDTDPISSVIFEKIDCDTILSEANIDISNNPGDTPFAQSEGKTCLHRTDYLWYDHHIQEGGTVIQLYAKIYDIDTIKAKYDLAERVGVTDEIFKQALQYFIKNKQNEMTELLTIKYLGTTPTYTIRSDKTKTPEIYVYKDGIYVPDGMSYIYEFCDKILGKWYTQNIANKILDKIKVRTIINSEDFFKEEDPSLIPVKNGILNILDKKLYQFTSKKRFFNKLPISYRPDIKSETTIHHLKTVLNGDQDILVMQELYGYLLFRSYKWEKAFMFYGDGGNGKSKTIEQMKYLIGENNCVNISLQTLQNEKFSRSQLQSKLANLADDIGQAKLQETQIFKEITGGSTITADRKFMNSVTFKSYAKMIFSANNIPDTVDNTDAFWRRWELIGFTKKFISPLEYEKLLVDGILDDNHRRADTEIIDKLTTPEELSGVLNWALCGLDRLRSQNGFSRPNSIEEVKTLWKRKASSSIAFVQDCIEQTAYEEDYERHDDLYNSYIKYCVKNKIRAESDRSFKKYLQEENLLCQRKHISLGQEWRWKYIKLKEEYKNDKSN